MISHLLDWFDLRTGYRALVRRALYEELPSGTGWAFTTGSVVTLLVGCQFITGVGLSMYYVPAPSLAYDSVRFIMDDLPLGWLLRGLHYWGASFLVVAAVVRVARGFCASVLLRRRDTRRDTCRDTRRDTRRAPPLSQP